MPSAETLFLNNHTCRARGRERISWEDTSQALRCARVGGDLTLGPAACLTLTVGAHLERPCHVGPVRCHVPTPSPPLGSWGTLSPAMITRSLPLGMHSEVGFVFSCIFVHIS